MKGIFLDTDFWLFGLTVFISVFHVSTVVMGGEGGGGKYKSCDDHMTLYSSLQLLFDFLAFKNDISFWRHRKTMVGLSTRTSKCYMQQVLHAA